MAYLLIIIYVAVLSFRTGVSQYLAALPVSSETSFLHKQAFKLDSTNPEIFSKQGEFFIRKGNYQAAAAAFKKATDLRGNDYFLWLWLGYAHYKMNDFDNARSAYEKAINLAPNYAQPYHFMGWLFLKKNDPEQAFFFMRKSVAIDVGFLPDALNSAHEIYSNDASAIERAIQPDSNELKRLLAEDFIKNNIMSDGIKSFLTGDELGRDGKDYIINRLIESKNISLAFEIWYSKDKPILTDFFSGYNLVLNGNFEADINADEKGFGWQIRLPKNDNYAISLDKKDAYSGQTSLLIEFDGNSDPRSTIISQLLPILPDRNYRLTFAGRTQELITGGLPVIKIYDAISGSTLGQSTPVSGQNNNWQKYTIDFKTGNRTGAAIISLQRLNCSSNCPVFGNLWLDDFVLKETKK